MDNLSKGLTPETATVNGTVQLKDMVVRTTNVNADYTLAAEDYTTTITDYEGNEPEYAGGKTITVTLTDSGLTKISKWAADEKESKTKRQGKGKTEKSRNKGCMRKSIPFIF